MTIELTEQGLSVSSTQEIIEAKGNRLKAQFGPNLDTDPTESIAGQLIAIQAEHEALVGQAALALYRSIDPNNAIGRALDARLAYTGTTRNGATRSEVTGLLEFNAAGTFTAGDLIRNDDTNELWQLLVTVVAGGAGFFAATFQAVDTGPKIANAGTTWSIVTVNPDVTGFTNASDDAEPGRDLESDADAKIRRNTELYSQNIGGLAAIRSVVSRVNTVQTVRVYHNPTVNPVDSDGIPFKAFNVLVELTPSVPSAATEQALYDAIFSALGAGGEAYGTDYSGTAIDDEGVAHPIAFDTVSLVNIVLEIDLVTSTSEDPISPNIEATVAAHILETAQANHETPGRDVRALDYEGIVQNLQATGEITGVDDVIVRMSIDPAPPTLVAKLAVAIREKADFDSANITVTQV